MVTQGECGIDNADNEHDHEFGRLKNRNQHALASCHIFFRDRQLYLLYLWEMLNIHDLLGSALQKNNIVSATNGSSGVPSVVVHCCDDNLISDRTSPTSSGGSVIAPLGKSIEKHGQSLLDVAKMDAKEKGKEECTRSGCSYSATVVN